MRQFTDKQKLEAAKRATKHGMCRTKIYKVYHNMKSRCFNPKASEYKDYGGRGITICDEWLGKYGFERFAEWAFSNGWDERKSAKEQTIERNDVNGNYCPENCSIIPMYMQYFNRRDTHNIDIDGVTKTLKEWSDLYGVPMSLINLRMKKLGWDEKSAVKTPVKTPKPRRDPITYNGKTQGTAAWSRELGINQSTIQARMDRGLPPELVLFQGKLNRRSKRINLEERITNAVMEKLTDGTVEPEAKLEWSLD